MHAIRRWRCATSCATATTAPATTPTAPRDSGEAALRGWGDGTCALAGGGWRRSKGRVRTTASSPGGWSRAGPPRVGGRRPDRRHCFGCPRRLKLCLPFAKDAPHGPLVLQLRQQQPARRPARRQRRARACAAASRGPVLARRHGRMEARGRRARAGAVRERAATVDAGARSEEHTSELQSLMRLSYAVISLKKKKNNKPIQTHNLLTQ